MLSITSIVRRPRRRIVLLTVAVVAAVCLIPTALAGGSNTYNAGSFSCQYAGGSIYTSGNVIRVNPPLLTAYTATYGGLANVWWMPVVYRQAANGSWYVYNQPKDWVAGAANGNTSSGNWTENYHLFQNIPKGTYAVLNYYAWESGATGNSWSPYGSTGSYTCRF